MSFLILGLTNRKCTGSDAIESSWDVPDFSDCVTSKYEDLLREVSNQSSDILQHSQN